MRSVFEHLQASIGESVINKMLLTKNDILWNHYYSSDINFRLFRPSTDGRIQDPNEQSCPIFETNKTELP